jgi:hypothetical protein
MHCKSRSKMTLMQNSLQTATLCDRNLIRNGTFYIRYRGCITVDHDVVGRFMDFLVPRRESGIIGFRLKPGMNCIDRRIGMIECSEDDLHPNMHYPFNLLIRIRNIYFFEAMLFVSYEGKIYRFMQNDGLGSLQVSTETFREVWNQINKR